MGALVGAASGALIAYVRLPAIIVGLCGLFVLTRHRAGDPAHPRAGAGELDRASRREGRPDPGRPLHDGGAAHRLVRAAADAVRAGHVLRRRRRADRVRRRDQRRPRPDPRLRARRDVRRDRRPRAHRPRALGRLLARAAVHAHRDRRRVARRNPGGRRPRRARRRAARRDVHLPHPEPALGPGDLRAVARRRLRLRAASARSSSARSCGRGDWWVRHDERRRRHPRGPRALARA